MADLDNAHEAPERQLWDQLEDVHAVMLGLPEVTQHMQPMAPQVDEAGKRVWFFTSTETDLVKSIGPGGKEGAMVIIGKNHDYHASIEGMIRINKDESRIEKYWSSTVAAWFPDGTADPRLTMLEFVPREAAIWASTGNAMSFGWEIAKANLTDTTPDVGVHNIIKFPRAA